MLLSLSRLYIRTLSGTIKRISRLDRDLENRTLRRVPRTGTKLSIGINNRLSDPNDRDRDLFILKRVLRTILSTMVTLKRLRQDLRVRTTSLLRPINGTLLALIRLERDMTVELLLSLFRHSKVLRIANGNRSNIRTLFRDGIRLRCTIYDLLTSFLTISMRRGNILIKMSLSLNNLTYTLYVTTTNSISRKRLKPMYLMSGMTILLNLTIGNRRTLIITTYGTTLITNDATGIRRIPTINDPRPKAVLRRLDRVLIMRYLVLLNMILTLKVITIPISSTLNTMLKSTSTSIKILNIRLIRPKTILLRLTTMPTRMIIMTLCVNGIVRKTIGENIKSINGNNRANKVRLARRLLRIIIIIRRLLTSTTSRSLIKRTPRRSKKIIMILSSRLNRLIATILIDKKILLGSTSRKSLDPSNRTRLIAYIMRILTILVINRASNINARLLSRRNVLMIVLDNRNITLMRAVLVTDRTTRQNKRTISKRTIIQNRDVTTSARINMSLIGNLIILLRTNNRNMRIKLIRTPRLNVKGMRNSLNTITKTRTKDGFITMTILSTMRRNVNLFTINSPTLSLGNNATILNKLKNSLSTKTTRMIRIGINTKRTSRIRTTMRTTMRNRINKDKMRKKNILIKSLSNRLIITLITRINSVNARSKRTTLINNYRLTISLRNYNRDDYRRLGMNTTTDRELLKLNGNTNMSANNTRVTTITIRTIRDIPNIKRNSLLNKALTLKRKRNPIFIRKGSLSRQCYSF